MRSGRKLVLPIGELRGERGSGHLLQGEPRDRPALLERQAAVRSQAVRVALQSAGSLGGSAPPS